MKVLIFLICCATANCGRVQDIDAAQTIKIYSTSKTNPGFILQQGSFGAVKVPTATQVIVNATVKHQSIIGFGGTFTDASGLSLNTATKDVRSKVLEALFGDEGIGVNLCRVPIGATEFSTRTYTLDDFEGDITLSKFALQTEDTDAKIPLIKEAQTVRKGNLKLFASAWTAPIWMKDHKKWSGYTMLDQNYGQVYAQYLKKFLDEYEEKGVKWWGMTTGTLPINGFKNREPNSMGWLPDVQSKWIQEHLGPTIRNSTHKNIKIIGHDDSSETFPYFAPVYTEDENTLKYVDGLATHWLMNTNIHPSINDFAKSDKKELFLLASDTNYGNVTPLLDNWAKALKVLGQLYTRLQWNFVGWVDYNLILNSKGGPSYANIASDAPIILSEDGKSFTKTPAYYVLGHFSKFVIPGSVRIDVNLEHSKLYVTAVAFLRPDNLKVVNIYNANVASIVFQLNDDGKYSQPIEVPGQSFHTLLY